MRLEIQCPHCGTMMEPMPDTEWTDGETRAIDMLCPNCLHSETIYLPAERKERNGK